MAATNLLQISNMKSKVRRHKTRKSKARKPAVRRSGPANVQVHDEDECEDCLDDICDDGSCEDNEEKVALRWVIPKLGLALIPIVDAYYTIGKSSALVTMKGTGMPGS